jgi:hypothetical protein
MSLQAIRLASVNRTSMPLRIRLPLVLYAFQSLVYSRKFPCLKKNLELDLFSYDEIIFSLDFLAPATIKSWLRPCWSGLTASTQDRRIIPISNGHIVSKK